MSYLKSSKVWAWAFYDFADTVFSALFITFFYPILIKSYLGGNEFQVGLVMGLSLLTAGLLVPVIGAMADASGKKIPLLFISTLATVILTVAAGYVGLASALAIGFLANLANIIDIDLYDSKLIDIAKPAEVGRVSGLGVALGYIGAIVTLGLGYLMMSSIGWEKKEAIQAIFITTALFYFIFSLPLFFLIKDKVQRPVKFKETFKKARQELADTLTRMGQFKGLGNFLLASFIYNDAMNTVIIFLSLYGTQQIGLSIQEFFPVFAIMSVGAFIGSLIAGKFSDQIGPKKMLSAALVLWIGVILFLLTVNNLTTFLIGGVIGGAVLGAVWVGNRHMVTKLSPPHKIAEIFGIEGLTEKFSGVIGPILFGYVVVKAGYQAALVVVLGFFLVGLIVLQTMPKDIDKK